MHLKEMENLKEQNSKEIISLGQENSGYDYEISNWKQTNSYLNQ